jgi:hypothetical protein
VSASLFPHHRIELGIGWIGGNGDDAWQWMLGMEDRTKTDDSEKSKMGCRYNAVEDNEANNDCRRIQTWALEEARRRLEVEGILKEPEDKP